MPKVHSRFNPPKSAPLVGGVSKTDQSFKDECDINVIVARYGKTGVLVDPGMVARRGSPMFGDFTSVPEDLIEAHAIFERAEESFGALSSEVRAKFRNSPVELLEWLSDDKNLEESYALGLRTRPEDPVPKGDGAPSPVA